jgi:hypothetical protein
VHVQFRKLSFETLTHGHRDCLVQVDRYGHWWSCREEDASRAGERGEGLGGEEGGDEDVGRRFEEGEVGCCRRWILDSHIRVRFKQNYDKSTHCLCCDVWWLNVRRCDGLPDGFSVDV